MLPMPTNTHTDTLAHIYIYSMPTVIHTYIDTLSTKYMHRDRRAYSMTMETASIINSINEIKSQPVPKKNISIYGNYNINMI